MPSFNTTRILLLAFLFILTFYRTNAQHDTAYYHSYQNSITGRFYFSQKYTSLRIKNTQDKYTLLYSPNTSLNMGIGATYKWATLNLAYGFRFLNPDKEKGKTRYLDLQFHGYGEKVVIDFLGQLYRGFYLYPGGRGTVNDKGYYKRPDLNVTLMGATVQYIVNYKRFSFRSSVFQSEMQKKSAGTILVGFETHVGRVRADSTLTPYTINAASARLNENKASFFDIGINTGYAYTLIIKRNYFITGAATISLNYGFSKLENDSRAMQGSGVTSNTLFRLGTGYTTSSWGISLVFINNDVRIVKIPSYNFSLHVGNVRLNLIYRFAPGKRGKRILKKLIK